MSGINALQKLPPHVARELRRHISPKPLISPFAKQKTKSPSDAPPPQSERHRMVFIGCTALTALAGCTPLVLYYWVKPLNESDIALTAPQIRRGAYQNSGSKDVGKDPDWNFSNGTHKYRAGYGERDDENKDNNALPAEFLAMAPQDLNKIEDKIEAFAKGRGRNN